MWQPRLLTGGYTRDRKRAGNLGRKKKIKPPQEFLGRASFCSDLCLFRSPKIERKMKMDGERDGEIDGNRWREMERDGERWREMEREINGERDGEREKTIRTNRSQPRVREAKLTVKLKASRKKEKILSQGPKKKKKCLAYGFGGSRTQVK